LSERYVGTKFTTVFLRRRAPADEKIGELARWCRVFHSRGLTPVVEGKSMGNLSYRLRRGSEEFITTASGLGPKDSLGPDCFVKVVGFDLDRRVVYASGVREPSSESILHGRIYELREDVNAIFHGHSPLVMARAKERGLAETRRWYPYGTVELVRSVEEVIGQNDFVVMKDHGFLSLGGDMGTAGRAALDLLE